MLVISQETRVHGNNSFFFSAIVFCNMDKQQTQLPLEQRIFGETNTNNRQAEEFCNNWCRQFVTVLSQKIEEWREGRNVLIIGTTIMIMRTTTLQDKQKHQHHISWISFNHSLTYSLTHCLTSPYHLVLIADSV